MKKETAGMSELVSEKEKKAFLYQKLNIKKNKNILK